MYNWLPTILLVTAPLHSSFWNVANQILRNSFQPRNTGSRETSCELADVHHVMFTNSPLKAGQPRKKTPANTPA